MDSSSNQSSQPSNAPLAGLLSLIVPGAGQLYLKKRWRGIGLLALLLALALLIQWGFVNFQIGLLTVGSFSLSWLWLVLAVLWGWNVVDARRIARGESSRNWIGLLLAAVIIYFLAWNVTDVKLDRLVTRFPDAVNVMKQLVRPDLFTRDEATGVLSPSENFTDIFGKIMPAPNVSYMAGKLVETIAIGLLATLFSIFFAVPLSFLAAHNIMSRIPGGQIVYYAMRTFLNVVRAVDPVIWGLVLIVWVGLGNLAGILALTIHSVAALGKLYSEEIEHIDLGPIEAVTSTGANLLQVVRYAVVPQIVPSFLGYSLLRWDINMRMATIIGFVAGGGIGFFVLETIRKGAYDQYAAALWAVAVVIILVDYISSVWRQRIMQGSPSRISQVTATFRGQLIGSVTLEKREPEWRAPVQLARPIESAPRPFYRSARNLILILVIVVLFIYSWNVTRIDLRSFFEPAPTFGRLIRDFAAIDLSPDVFDAILKQLLITVFQALIATTLGGLLAVPFSFLAARNLMNRSVVTRAVYYVVRSVFNVLRSIEALLYVAIFVAWVGIGSFAGSLALAITTFALIGKLFSEAIENIDPGPLEALTATGATRLQAIVYAILPQIVPPFVSYSIYQWDINVRMATIIGFAGGGGVGLLLSTYFGQLQYHKAGTVILLIVIVVAAMDFASARIREKMV